MRGVIVVLLVVCIVLSLIILTNNSVDGYTNCVRNLTSMPSQPYTLLATLQSVTQQSFWNSQTTAAAYPYTIQTSSTTLNAIPVTISGAEYCATLSSICTPTQICLPLPLNKNTVYSVQVIFESIDGGLNTTTNQEMYSANWPFDATVLQRMKTTILPTDPALMQCYFVYNGNNSGILWYDLSNSMLTSFDTSSPSVAQGMLFDGGVVPPEIPVGVTLQKLEMSNVATPNPADVGPPA